MWKKKYYKTIKKKFNDNISNINMEAGRKI